MQSPFVKQMLNSWIAKNRVGSQDWNNVVTTILEIELQKQRRTWWKDVVWLLNNEVEVDLLKFPKTNFSEKAIMLNYKDSLYKRITSGLKVIKQL